MLLNVGDAEHEHAEEVHANTNDGKDMVVDDVSICALLHRKEAHERDGIEAAEKAPVPVGEHESEKIVTDVRGGEVGRLNQVVVENVIPGIDKQAHVPHQTETLQVKMR